MTLGVIPDELEAKRESTGTTSSISAWSFILKSGRSGAFSWTRSASESASFMLVVKLRRSRDVPFQRPMLVTSFHASSISLPRVDSAFGAGSVATTSNPRARYSAAQLAPMTPVSTAAIRRIGLLYDISVFPCVDFYASKLNDASTERRVVSMTRSSHRMFLELQSLIIQPTRRPIELDGGPTRNNTTSGMLSQMSALGQ